MKKFLLDSTRSFLATFVALATVLLLATITTAWTGPTGTAPNNNVSAPINVGLTAQTKAGAFASSDFIAANEFCIPGATPECINGWGTMEGGTVTTVTAASSPRGTSAVASCPAGTLRVGCSGSRESGLADTCDESSCAYIGTMPTGADSCTTAIDPSGGSGEEAVAYAYCLSL